LPLGSFRRLLSSLLLFLFLRREFRFALRKLLCSGFEFSRARILGRSVICNSFRLRLRSCPTRAASECGRNDKAHNDRGDCGRPHDGIRAH
jgi:hypothetical protein